MGQVFIPSSGGITVIPTDRESGPGAGGGASGNRDLFLGALAGFNSTASDLIALGNNAMSAGMVDAAAGGTIAIGSQTLKALTNAIPSALITDGPSLAVGYNIAPNMTGRFASSVLLGPNIYTKAITGNFPGDVSGSVLIGAEVLANNQVTSLNGPGAPRSVIIGYQAAKGVTTTQSGAGCHLQTSVIIGALAAASCGFDGPTPGSSISADVVIGYNCAFNLAVGQNNSSQQNVLIGYNIAITGALQNNTVLGASVVLGSGSNNNVVVGASTTANWNTTGGNTVVGQGASIGVGIGGRNIVLGFGSGGDIPGSGNDYFNVETFDGSTKRSAIFANMASGNVVLGNSSTAQRDLQGIGCTNGIKIPNGTRGAGNPNTGGFFYVAAGALHWVGSAGTDTVVAPA